MKKLIVANLKMNMDYPSMLDYIDKVNKNIVVCPSFIFIPFLIDKVEVGAQDCSIHEKGSYTGQISPLHLKQMGVNYVLIGHSERRKYEDDVTINNKVKKALANNLKVILCIGENKDDDKEVKLLNQLQVGLKDVDLSDVIIAYEPIWAIGTNLTPSNAQISETSNFIKEYIKNNFDKDINVLYGGSVDVNNIEILNNINNIDGFLVGRAATNYKQINEIYNIVNN